MSTPLDNLPLETFQEILSHVNDLESLRTASAVSRVWQEHFQPKLFKTSVVTITLDTEEGQAMLLELARAKVLSYIIAVQVQTTRPCDEIEFCEPILGFLPFPPALRAFLSSIPNCTSLTLKDMRWNWNALDDRDQSAILQVFSQIRELWLYSRDTIFTIPLSILLHAPQLKKLEVYDMPPGLYWEEEEFFPWFCLGHPNPQVQQLSIHTLSLKDTGLIARFTDFARKHGEWRFFSEIQELNLCFNDLGEIKRPRNTTSCGIIGSFLKNFGGNVRRLNLHIMRSEIHSGSLIPTSDLESLIHLESLEIILHVDNNEEMDICPFPQTWLCPFLQSLPSADSISRLLITYQLYIPEGRSPYFDKYSEPLPLLWESLDIALGKWYALRQLEFYIDLYRRDTCEDTRSEREPGATFEQIQVYHTLECLGKRRQPKVEIVTMSSDPKTRKENSA
ncbi:hypothetical protein NP233_g3333 [Leucocoprinus birnbaumii]|uniref:F-box domain-containing protein n=1 Tax=Leucocoprinus birnbaumii TaxID=56174 RepID=A0AAD5VXE4_9AGAR|nr:hypothetical protein NP233_g3333 [Leucocoprinus birnbaumii]